MTKHSSPTMLLLVLALSLLISSLSAQSNCATPIWEPNFSGNEAFTTLCQEFEDFVPDPGFTFSGTTLSSSIFTPFNNKFISISGKGS